VGLHKGNSGNSGESLNLNWYFYKNSHQKPDKKANTLQQTFYYSQGNWVA